MSTTDGCVITQEDDKKHLVHSTHINLKIKAQDGNVAFFRITRSTEMKKLMNAYCDKQSLETNSIVFLFDSQPLRAQQTPHELEMKEGDEIDAMLYQFSG